MFLVVDSLLSNQNAGMPKTQPEYLFHPNAVIPHKTSQQAHARLVTTLDLRQPRINTASRLIHVDLAFRAHFHQFRTIFDRIDT